MLVPEVVGVAASQDERRDNAAAHTRVSYHGPAKSLNRAYRRRNKYLPLGLGNCIGRSVLDGDLPPQVYQGLASRGRAE
jgi:hypothetical protein